MLTSRAYAAHAADRPLAPTTLTRREVGPHDVLLDIKFAGICHSDIHTVRGEWGPVQYPLVPGHEIAGIVAAVGSAVTKHAVGDRVGVGCLVDACGECAGCRKGEEQFCPKQVQTYAGVGRDGQVTQGGYATHIVVAEDFVVKIPASIPLEAAAPLLCAGITTYSPLRHWGAGPGKRVAVVGLGGLGHMAVKLARAMGAEVTVLSRSPSKREDALRLGAHHFHATQEVGTFEKLAMAFDLVINTVSAPIDLNAYLSTVAADGTLVNVGAPPQPLQVNALTLIIARRSFAGSMIGGIRETQEMLDFCAEHGVVADIELIAADGINEAYERVLASDVRYRFVIDAATFGQG